MELDLLAQLMLPKEKRPKKVPALDFTKGFALVRTDAGIEKQTLSKEVKASLGRFDSKQGSIKRSRKGRTSIRPNGYARYNAITELDVIAYKV